MTAEINRLIGDFPHHRDRVLGRLQLCDAAIHGRRIRVPTLAMLARRDEVVPAPSAAAVFNAIDADPGRKWRFVVPYGHFAGGIANARRHALFERAMVDFFDPSRSPIEAMTPWEPILHEGVEDPQGHVPGIAQANETEK